MTVKVSEDVESIGGSVQPVNGQVFNQLGGGGGGGRESLLPMELTYCMFVMSALRRG